jgi:hypothetical protein
VRGPRTTLKRGTLACASGRECFLSANVLGGGPEPAGAVSRVNATGTIPNMLGTFFQASGSLDVAEIASGPVQRSPIADAKGLTEVSLGTLGEILGVGGADDLADRIGADGFEADHGEAGVFSLPNEFRDALADLIDLDGVSTRWSETEELVADRWRAVDTRDALQRMRTVAQTAREAGNPLYYWWSL